MVSKFSLRAVALMALSLCSSVLQAQTYIFVQVDPFRPGNWPNDNHLTPNFPVFDENSVENAVRVAEAVGFNEVATDALKVVAPNFVGNTWSLAPYFHDRADGGSLKLKGLSMPSPVGASWGNNPCQGAFFCAFQLSNEESRLIAETGEVRIGLSGGGDLPKTEGEFINKSYFSTLNCKLNTRCPLYTSYAKNVVGEVVVQEFPTKRSCIFGDAAYLRAFYTYANSVLALGASKKESYQVLTGHSMSYTLPNVKINVDAIAARCTPILELPKLIEATQLNSRNDKFMLFSAVMFAIAERHANDSFKINFKADRTYRKAVKKKGVNLSKTSDSKTHTVEIMLDYSNLLGRLKDAYEVSGTTLFAIESNTAFNKFIAIQLSEYEWGSGSSVSLPRTSEKRFARLTAERACRKLLKTGRYQLVGPCPMPR